MSDDGMVGRVLKISTLVTSKNRKTPTIVRVFRMPWGSYPYYMKKDGSTNSVMYYMRNAGGFSTTSIAKATTKRYGKGMTKKKLTFAYYWLVKEMPPHLAYMKAFNMRSDRMARRDADYLIHHEGDRLLSEISTTYKKLFDQKGLNDEGIVEAIADIIGGSKVPAKDKLAALELALEMRGELSKQGNAKIMVNNNVGIIPMGSAQVTAPAVRTSLPSHEPPALTSSEAGIPPPDDKQSDSGDSLSPSRLPEHPQGPYTDSSETD
jgi:hypothetical protein